MDEQELTKRFEEQGETQSAASQVTSNFSDAMKATLLKALRSGKIEVASESEIEHLIAIAQSIKKSAKIKVRMGKQLVTTNGNEIAIQHSAIKKN